MNFLPETTLACYEATPAKKLFDLSLRPIKSFASATKTYQGTCGELSPDLEALEFYAYNHYYSRLLTRFTRNESMPEWAVSIAKKYSETLTQQSERMMHYLLCIITREIRHLDSSKLAKYKADVIALGGFDMHQFLVTILKVGESQAVARYRDNPPEVAAGPYVRCIELLFNNGWPEKTAYGGKAWGQIAKTAGDFLYGKISLEMMVDNAYTLAHNNGPIFNKGMMYSGYSSYFKKLLDVQRSGQIPELVRDTEITWVPKSTMLAEATDLMFTQMPEEFGQYVDWNKVKLLGGLTNVDSEIAAQNKKYGAKADTTSTPTTPVVTKSAVGTFAGKPAQKTGKYYVFPNQSVDVYSREQYEK